MVPPIFKKHWKIYIIPKPPSSCLLKLSLFSDSTVIISRNTFRHTIITIMPNNPPNSSEIAGKIKSFVTTGIEPGSPLVSPVPNQPPFPIAKMDCTS